MVDEMNMPVDCSTGECGGVLMVQFWRGKQNTVHILR